MTHPSSSKLITLEAGRFIAATGVMLFHYTGVVADFQGVTVFGDIFRPGHIGVPYFFVLSGFIIYHVHRADLGQPGAVLRFITKRAVRLFPMFLAVSLVMLLAFLLSPKMAGQRDLTPFGVVTDLLLLPHADSILSISWTLRHEIVFYALFALALRFGSKAFWAIGAWIAISMATGLYALAAGLDTIPWMGSWSVVASTLNLGFGLGILVAVNARRPSKASPLPLISLGAGLMLMLYGLEWFFGRGVPHGVDVLGPLGTPGYMLAAAALISGLVRLEEHWRVPAANFWKLAGGSSYLLYLIHQPLASVVLRLLRRFDLPAEASFAILVALAITTAFVLHLTIEKWALKRLSGLGRMQAAVAPTTLPPPAIDTSDRSFALTATSRLGQSHEPGLSPHAAPPDLSRSPIP